MSRYGGGGLKNRGALRYQSGSSNLCQRLRAHIYVNIQTEWCVGLTELW